MIPNVYYNTSLSILLYLWIPFTAPTAAQTDSLAQSAGDTIPLKKNVAMTTFQTDSLSRLARLAQLRLWLWQHDTLPAISPGISNKIPRLMPPIANFTANPNAAYREDYDFRSDLSYRLKRVERLRREASGAPSNVLLARVRIPIGNLGKKICPDVNLTNLLQEGQLWLSDRELDMLEVLWVYRELSTPRWYQLYYQNFKTGPLTYTVFLEYINQLEAKRVLCRKKSHYIGMFYDAAFSLPQFLNEIKNALAAIDVLSKPKRYRVLSNMYQKLENVLFSDLYFSRYRHKHLRRSP